MKNKKIIFVISILVLVFLVAIFYAKKNNPFFFAIHNNIKEKSGWFQNLKNEGEEFVSKDKKISFKYPSYIRLERKDDAVTFWIIGGDAKDDIGEIAAYGFDFKENRQGDINELYKENIFYKENPKYFYGKKDISISGHPAVLYNFCDSKNGCDEKEMIHEIFIQYKDIIYSFNFGARGLNLQQEILNSAQFD